MLTDKVRAAATEAIYKRQPLMLSEFLSLPTLQAVPVDSGVAALLLGLFNGPMTFAALVDHWRTLRSVDWVTLAPVTVEAAQLQVIEMLGSLETFLYVLVEPRP
jgi:hypothetical protein